MMEELQNKPRKEWFKTRWGAATVAVTGLVLLIMLVVVGVMGKGDKKPAIKPPTGEELRVESAVINLNEYIDKDASYFVEKLGNPVDGEVYANPPIWTNWLWNFEGYSIDISFEKGRRVQYINAQFTDGECAQKPGNQPLGKVGLNYPTQDPDIKQDGHLYRWEPYNESYERLNIYCNDLGTSIVLISETAE